MLQRNRARRTCYEDAMRKKNYTGSVTYSTFYICIFFSTLFVFGSRYATVGHPISGRAPACDRPWTLNYMTSMSELDLDVVKYLGQTKQRSFSSKLHFVRIQTFLYLGHERAQYRNTIRTNSMKTSRRRYTVKISVYPRILCREFSTGTGSVYVCSCKSTEWLSPGPHGNVRPSFIIPSIYG